MRRPARTIRAEARVDQRGEEGRIRGTVLLFVERPERVRFDAMTQLGPAAVLTSDGEEFQLLDLREDRFLHGPSCPENISRLLGIPMSGEDLTRFVLGDTPRIAARSESIRCTGGGTYLITLEGEGGERQQIELAIREADLEAPVTEQRLRLLRSEVFDAEGATIWRATFGDYRVVPDPLSEAEPPMGVAMPFTIHFEGRGADTLVRFRSIDLNAEPPADAFHQQPPPGIAIEYVGCR